MTKRPDLESRLRAYLSSGARTPAPAGMEERIAGRVLGRRYSWAFQLIAAAAVLVLAIGLGIGVSKLRQSNAALNPSPSPSPIVGPSASASPSVTPTARPTPHAGGPYPLLPPSTFTMINATTGWAAGSGTNRILRTTDGGATWADVTPTGARTGTWISYFLDANDAWIASSVQPGSGSPDFSVAVYRTSNGGQTWQQVGQAAADQGWPAALDFVDARHGWLFMQLGFAAGSDGVAFYGTTDGGASWAKLSEADTSGAPGHLPLSCSKVSPVFLNGATGWEPGACGAGGGPFLYVTRDGGRTWKDAAIPLPAAYPGSCMCEITSLRFSDPRNGVFVLVISGGDGQRSVLYTTRDGGASWQPGPLLPAQTYEVYFIDMMHGWTVNGKANNSLLYTSDGGQHWSTVGTIPSTQGVVHFQFVSAAIGWVMGSEPAGNTLIKTADGGQTWTTQLRP